MNWTTYAVRSTCAAEGGEGACNFSAMYKQISYVLPRLKIDRVRHKFSGGSFIGVQAFRGVLTLAGSLLVSLLQTSARSCSA